MRSLVRHRVRSAGRGRRTSTGIAAVLGMAILFTACSSGGGSSGGGTGGGDHGGSPGSTSSPSGSNQQASGADPCQLVTNDEASALLGGTITRTGPKEENRLVDCKWDNGGGGFLLITVGQGAEFYDPDLTNPGWKPVSGLGDKAFEDDKTQSVGFIDGQTVVNLFVAFHQIAMPDLVGLARTADGRL